MIRASLLRRRDLDASLRRLDLATSLQPCSQARGEVKNLATYLWQPAGSCICIATKNSRGVLTGPRLTWL